MLTVITGGTRGIGAATALLLASEGHDLVLAYARDDVAAAEVAGDVRSHGVRCLALRANVADEDDVERLFEAAEALGPVTGLVNNAGVTGRLGRLVDARTEDLRAVLDVNLLGTLLCCRRAARTMGPGSSIVNISSAAATLGSPGDYVHYAASKAAVDAVTIGLSKELGPNRIRVNAVAPGLIDTEMHAAMGDPDRASRVGSQTPLGRAGRAEEIAAAISWLLSPQSSYTTGAVLRVAGGR